MIEEVSDAVNIGALSPKTAKRTTVPGSAGAKHPAPVRVEIVAKVGGAAEVKVDGTSAMEARRGQDTLRNFYA